MSSTLTAEREDRKELIYLPNVLHLYPPPHCYLAHWMVVPSMLPSPTHELQHKPQQPGLPVSSVSGICCCPKTHKLRTEQGFSSVCRVPGEGFM